jgi:hypothetical protein
VVEIWNAEKKTPVDRNLRIVVKVPNPYTQTKRRARFDLYTVFPTVGGYCDAFVVLRDAGLMHRVDTDAIGGMGDIHWDRIRGYIELVGV